ncbi:MAG: dihydroneopterin aldolase [Phenylobacterium sp.]|nr:dihydroneopterin aldolase [Phenylobacterium sp.]
MALSPVTESDLPPQTLGARVVATKVFVTGLKVDAHIGVYAHERGRTQPLVIDVELDAATAGAEHLSDTVNYELVAEAARQLAGAGHIDLVETFAERLALACLEDPKVSRARVRVDKPQALAPHAESAGVEVVLVRA